MGILKGLLILLLVLATMGAAIAGSYMLAQDNPFDGQHKHKISIVEATEPTCDVPGTRQHYVCSECEVMFADENGYVVLEAADVAVSPLGHNWNDATCGEARTCEFCDATDGEKREHNPGNPVKENIIPATCISEGSYDSVVYCTACGEKISSEAMVSEKKSHIPGISVIENEQASTCYAEGSYDIVVYCSVDGCGIEMSRNTVLVNMIKHTPAEAVKEKIVSASCNEAGSYDSVVYCSVEGCKIELSREAMVEDALGHTDINPKDSKCDRCDVNLCTNHNTVIDPAKAPTCTEPGYTEGSHCSICNMVIKAQETIPAAHTYGIKATGTLAIANDGSCNTEALVVTRICTACDAVETITDYSVNVANAFESGIVVTYGEHTYTLPVLNTTNYSTATTKSGGDQAPTVTTTFTLKDGDFACTVISGDCIKLGDVLYSRYELDLVQSDNASVTYDVNDGYLYASKKAHAVTYLASYGATITITGDLEINTPVRVDFNNHIIIGTDEVAANVKIERTELVSNQNHIIGLYNGADLTIKNGTLKTVGIATSGWAVDIFAGHNGTLITIEEKGNYIAEGTGEYCIYSEKDTLVRIYGTITSVRGITHNKCFGAPVSGEADVFGCGFIPAFYVGNNANVTISGKSIFASILIDGSYTSNAGLTYIEGANVLSDAGEYGFIPGLYIRRGSVTLADRLYANGIQVGSEKEENASGILTINVADKDAIYGNNIKDTDDHFRCVFAKGIVNLTNTKTAKRTAMNMGTFDGELAILDIKSGVTVNVTNFEHFIGAWGKSYNMSWMIEEGATFNISRSSGSTSFATISNSANTRIISYKTAEINIDGEVKSVIIANISSATVATSSALTFPTVDTAAIWTTDTATATVNGFSKAFNTAGDEVYYQII